MSNDGLGQRSQRISTASRTHEAMGACPRIADMNGTTSDRRRGKLSWLEVKKSCTVLELTRSRNQQRAVCVLVLLSVFRRAIIDRP
jgi:hypothetical protein